MQHCFQERATSSAGPFLTEAVLGVGAVLDSFLSLETIHSSLQETGSSCVASDESNEERQYPVVWKEGVPQNEQDMEKCCSGFTDFSTSWCEGNVGIPV